MESAIPGTLSIPRFHVIVQVTLNKKWSGVELLFYQQYTCMYNPQLYQYTQLEATTNFYAVYSMLRTRKISINILAQKMLVEC